MRLSPSPKDESSNDSIIGHAEAACEGGLRSPKVFCYEAERFKEPVKWADGSITEATAWTLHPSVVELTTQRVVEKVESTKLDPKWLEAKFPDDPEVVLQSKLDEFAKALVELRKFDPVDPAAITRAFETLQMRIKALEDGNSKLKSVLKKQNKAQRKKQCIRSSWVRR